MNYLNTHYWREFGYLHIFIISEAVRHGTLTNEMYTDLRRLFHYIEFSIPPEMRPAVSYQADLMPFLMYIANVLELDLVLEVGNNLMNGDYNDVEERLIEPIRELYAPHGTYQQVWEGAFHDDDIGLTPERQLGLTDIFTYLYNDYPPQLLVGNDLPYLQETIFLSAVKHLYLEDVLHYKRLSWELPTDSDEEDEGDGNNDGEEEEL